MKTLAFFLPCQCLLMCITTAAQVAATSPTAVTPATGSTFTLSVRAALVDKDLNVKPIPKLVLILRHNTQGKDELTLTTNFEGHVEVQIPPGDYTLTTVRGLDYQGKRYSWSVPVKIGASGTTIELSTDNATIQDITSPPVRQTDELTTLFKRYEGRC